MLLDLTTALLVDIASGVLLVALGVFVATVKPRRREILGFAAFILAYGLAFVVGNLAWFLATPGSLVDTVATGASAALMVVAAVLLPPVALKLPAATAEDPRLARVAAAPALAFLALYLLMIVLDAPYVFQIFSQSAGRSVPVIVAWAASLGLLLASLWFSLYLFALRHARARSGDPAVRESLVLASAGLVLFPAFAIHFAHTGAAPFDVLGPALAEAGGWLLLGGLVVLWLRESRAAGLRAAVVVWLALGAALAGLLADAFFRVWFNDGGPGLMRIGGVLLLAYAILRSRLLGLDVKVRWTIRQSTLGAVFVAVFFVVSEGASVFFGEDNPYFGVLAAGALVFALAPLQRLAERVANAAVPATPGRATSGNLDLYRRQVEIAWFDGSLGANERLMLRELRAALVIPADEADRIESEVAERALRPRAGPRDAP